ncbi:hypothetical protein Tco_0241555 [Tanacetum coccineum]
MAQLKKLTFEELKLEQESSKKQKTIGIKDVLVIEEKVKTAYYETEEDVEAFVKGNSSSGTDIPVSVIRVAIKPPSIANWKIIKLDISRDDLTELYRLVMHKYGTNRPEEKYEIVFWGDLKTIVHYLTLKSADIYMLTKRKYPILADACQAMLDKKLQGSKEDEACYQLLKLIEKQD